MQLLLTGLPLLLCVGCTEVVYSMYLLELLTLLLFGGSYVLLMALVGLFLGIKMPTLTWTNEIMPIKQGGAVIITLLCGFVYMILLFAVFMLLSGWRLGFCRYMSCFVGANLVLSGWVYLWLRKKGTTRFSALWWQSYNWNFMCLRKTEYGNSEKYERNPGSKGKRFWKIVMKLNISFCVKRMSVDKWPMGNHNKR